MRLVFLVVALIGGAFIWISGQALPPIVPSHFDAGGWVNGHMPRTAYLGLISVITVLVPTIIVFAPAAAMRAPGARINLPNRDYWLAPARREATLTRIATHFAWFGIALVVFLCFTHWQVVHAVASSPVRMNMTAMNTGLGVFLGFVVLWVVAFWAVFSRVGD